LLVGHLVNGGAAIIISGQENPPLFLARTLSAQHIDGDKTNSTKYHFSRNFTMEDEKIDVLYAAAEDAVYQAHTWNAQLYFDLTSAVLDQSKDPSLFGLPVTSQDIFDVGSNSTLRYDPSFIANCSM
jgi:hypothetical protein